MFGINAYAEEFRIESFNSTGQLVFNEVTGATNYVVEQSYSLSGEWSPLTNIPPSGTGSITSSIPISAMATFFRTIAQIPPPLPLPASMALIPGGTNSGTNPLGTGEYYSVPYPENYSLTVSSFYMDRTEVTKAQWDTVYNWAVANGYSFDNAGTGNASNHPVRKVSWYDCVKWCNARSQMMNRTPCYTVAGSTYKTGQSSPDSNFNANGFRLPTNDEWEYAARGGLNSKRFPWGDTINHRDANYEANGSAYSYDTSSYTTGTYHPSYDGGTSPVGSFSPNGYGLYDMVGNVWEWCDTASGSFRYFRGGDYINPANNVRCGLKISDPPSMRTNGLGFRSVSR